MDMNYLAKKAAARHAKKAAPSKHQRFPQKNPNPRYPLIQNDRYCVYDPNCPWEDLPVNKYFISMPDFTKGHAALDFIAGDPRDAWLEKYGLEDYTEEQEALLATYANKKSDDEIASADKQVPNHGDDRDKEDSPTHAPKLRALDVPLKDRGDWTMTKFMEAIHEAEREFDAIYPPPRLGGVDIESPTDELINRPEMAQPVTLKPHRFGSYVKVDGLSRVEEAHPVAPSLASDKTATTQKELDELMKPREMAQPVTLKPQRYGSYVKMDGLSRVEEAHPVAPSLASYKTATTQKELDVDELDAMDWCGPSDKLSSWKMLDPAAAIKIDPEDLPDAEPVILQTECLIPNGLSWATQPTKKVPERQPQKVSQGFFRHVSQEASLDTLMSDSFEEEPSAFLPTPQSRFTQNAIAELDQLHEHNEELYGLVNKTEMNSGMAADTLANRKRLFGPKGLLGPLPAGKTDRRSVTKPVQKTFGLRGLSSRIMHRFTDMAIPGMGASQAEIQFSLDSQTQVSLPPEIQAKLCADLEMMICKVANDFLLRQYYENRVSAHSINKAVRRWEAKNRPHVVQFKFDQDTQRELVSENRRNMVFPEEYATNIPLLNATLQHWKSIVNDMVARTYCQPDSAIHITIHGVQQILEMLDAAREIMITFDNLSRWANNEIAKRRPPQNCFGDSSMFSS